MDPSHAPNFVPWERSFEDGYSASDTMRQSAHLTRHAVPIAALLAVLVAACGASTASPATPGASGTPAASASSAASVTPAPPATASPAPSGSAGICPSLPADFTAIRAVAVAGEAVGCFDNQDITFHAFAPVHAGLDIVDTSVMTPGWLANPFTGTILQAVDATVPDPSAWLVVRISLALGKCRITSEPEPCPFNDYLGKNVIVTGHFNDASAETCASVHLASGTDPGPSKSEMVARCKKEFVVTAIAAG